MSRHVTNFDNEIFTYASGFQSVRINTLPGRTLPPGDWFSTWPRLHHHTLPHSNSHQHHSIIGNDFFRPPVIPAKTSVDKDREVITVESAVFQDARPRIQVKDGKLRVYAARVRTSTKGRVAAREDDEFEYQTTLPRDVDVKKITAKREGSVLRITLPRK
ncbi:hypothetical protein GQ54DRAFT_183331 [Martensiomyces pterosporus]|nr:hypothetical protein GQ54DRAFT_183331 [Martensiomyces pterosporus]